MMAEAGCSANEEIAAITGHATSGRGDTRHLAGTEIGAHILCASFAGRARAAAVATQSATANECSSLRRPK